MESTKILKKPRKKRTRLKPRLSLPITLQSRQTSSFNHWKVCRGFYTDGSVLVHDLDEIEFLYTNGFFGKGAFSRGPPELLGEYLDGDDKWFMPYKKQSDVDAKNKNACEDEGTTSVRTQSIHEPLVLSLCEAFFLTYGLGCLIIYDEEKKPMSILKTWRHFLNSDPVFRTMYVAYHYFRSKGWVVRSGVKYGVTFVLYKMGPPFYHSTYSVLVESVQENSLPQHLQHQQQTQQQHQQNTKNNNNNYNYNKYNDNNRDHININNINNNNDKKNNIDDSNSSNRNDWTSLSRLNRITEQVAKELILCYVIQPSSPTKCNMNNEDGDVCSVDHHGDSSRCGSDDGDDISLNSPNCIKSFKVMTVVVKRWVSNKERNDEELN